MEKYITIHKIKAEKVDKSSSYEHPHYKTICSCGNSSIYTDKDFEVLAYKEDQLSFGIAFEYLRRCHSIKRKNWINQRIILLTEDEKNPYIFSKQGLNTLRDDIKYKVVIDTRQEGIKHMGNNISQSYTKYNFPLEDILACDWSIKILEY